MGKTFKMSATIVQYAICTSAAVCATAGSCCSKFATSSGGTIQTTAGTAVCWNAGSAVNASGVIPQIGSWTSIAGPELLITQASFSEAVIRLQIANDVMSRSRVIINYLNNETRSMGALFSSEST